MLDLDSWTTPDGDRLHLMFEATALARHVRVGAAEPRRPESRRVLRGARGAS